MSNASDAIPPGTAARVEETSAGALTAEEASRPRLALEAQVERSPNGWTVRLPLRAEHITIEKRVVLVERVVVRTTAVADQVRVEDTIQREQLQVTTEGQVRVVQANPGGGEASQGPVKPSANLPAWRGIPGIDHKP